ncbi:hypothetical protein ABB37_02334 [Leptomonas pyrrhocoris]|uniref:Uncharacterized protein n=1 Tax=Leptomonas pyrrhocoris TaxID=157538 RepID=A0A0N0VH15_LEPPY|nr:hypothetical protein ABB37_02334 [Leptomonas pyrrhocoris]XP_015662764.1 hypothetical protein ABB37_02334 [Leptomonas pyrrhocoris]KPA84324.1 hypothetical protein ABB37_02334 [Leptomonas pyrrhocoris]KPA84325.1 hypothetical protein ABB37_02334 [Leptomonas pyrrhocoris]|eukprot:XP_015662763.1 hypothetical protein ABB37_02334 [Leptomonas pyrrhocoris]
MFSKYRHGGSRDAYYVSPIRDAASSTRAPAQQLLSSSLSRQQQQHASLYDPAENNRTPALSPIPRTPVRYSSADVTGHADLRYPARPVETAPSNAATPAAGAIGAAAPSSSIARTPLPQHPSVQYAPSPDAAARYAPSPSAEEQLQRIEKERYRFSSGRNSVPFASNPGSLSVSPACWLCEGRCLTGPGSTWPQAPPLFFTATNHTLPVSTLTLCATCAAAVSMDMQATSREVLQRCQRTPATRYRTSAYVNAVREYKLLLELMAEKVVRACERMRCIHGVLPSTSSPHDAGDACVDAAVEVADAPLASFSLPLRQKVLRQLLEALEELLQRDGRAAQLAATTANRQKTAAVSRQVPLQQQQQHDEQEGLPYSEIMAPRERHVLLEELAHLERQLMPVSSAITAGQEQQHQMMSAEGRTRASPYRVSPASHRALALPSQRERSAGNVESKRRAAGDPRNYNAHVVPSPRPSPEHGRGTSQPLAAATSDPLSVLADPRRVQHRRRASTTAQDGGDMRDEDGDSRQRGPQNRSPPALTSPQRRRRGSGSGSEAGPPVTDRRGPKSASGTAPFPFAPAPHRDPSHSRSPAPDDAEGDAVGVRETSRNRNRDARSNGKKVGEIPSRGQRGQPQQRQRFHPALSSQGRRTMEALVGSAMWAMYRHSPPSPEVENRRSGGEGEGDEESEVDATRAAAADADADAPDAALSRNDPDNILLNYFAGRSDVTPTFRLSPPRTPSSFRRSALRRRPDAMVAAAAPAEGRLIDLNDGHDSSDHGGDLVAVGLQAQLDKERRRRRAAEEALLEAHVRVAALEQTTNDMAEELLAHRLSVTFRSHLEGMELLVSRWTLLAQNYCLQKSLLFAEEAAALVRAAQRDAFGVTSFLRKKNPPPATPPNGGNSTANGKKSAANATGEETAGEEADDELWVSREEEDGHAGAGGGGYAASRKVPPRDTSAPNSVPRRSASHTVLPRENATGAAPFTFPSDVRLKPLTLHL